MKIDEVVGDGLWPEWDDGELEISLESARNNLIKLRKRHPDKARSVPDDPKSGREMLAKAKELHAKNKAASMMSITIESYANELGLDADTQLLLESMSEES